MRLLTLATTLFALLLPLFSLRAQGLQQVERRTVTPADSAVALIHRFVIPSTLRLRLDDTIDLVVGADYTFDADRSLIRLLSPLRQRLSVSDSSAFDTLDASGLRSDSATFAVVHTLVISYSWRPILLESEYARRRLVTVVDSTGRKRRVAREGEALTPASIFGRNFQRSGSIVRGFTVGSNRDVSLQSGLRLQFSGLVTEDVEVVGALTDEQTPIQPEGNTQTLREIDNIFIEIRSPWVSGTLGKFVAADTCSSFTSFSRKLQGVRVRGRWGDSSHTTDAVFAVSPGRFRSQSIQGRERDQGPYRLSGENNQRDIIVVAGTERVYVDGVLMTRGESFDYVIDYSAAQITFQTRRPITSASRITVDFEYTDQKYDRSFFAAHHRLPIGDNDVVVDASYVREADNPDATIDLTLSDADRDLLARAGGDRSRAVRGGAYLVGRNDTLRGSYVRIDTIINGLPDSLFRYDPANPAAIYNVIFSTPPDGRGDYRYVSFGRYDYVAPGQGTYLPIVYLPLPALRQVGAISVVARPFGSTTLRGEISGSELVINRFSQDPSARLSGLALNIRADAPADSIRVGGETLGTFAFSASTRYVASGFRSIERLGEVEFENRWNSGVRPGESGTNDLVAEGALLWRPVASLELGGSAGYFARGDIFRSLRGGSTLRLIGDSLLPSADYAIEVISTDSLTLSGSIESNWLRQNGGVYKTFGWLTPGFRFALDNRQDRGAGAAGGGILPASFRAIEYGPEILIALPSLRTTMSLRYRTEDSARGSGSNAAFVRDGNATTFSLRGELAGISAASSTLDLTWRRRHYELIPGLPADFRLDNTTLLVRSQSRLNAFERGLEGDALYEVQTEQAARLQRVFQRVTFGQGEYVWIDLDSNGVESIEEFRLTNAGDGEYISVTLPTEDLFPVIDLRVSARLRLQPKRIFDPSSTIGALLSPFTSETYMRLEEKSQTSSESDVYLLRFSTMQNDSTTIVGSQILGQDLLLFEGNRDYSFRLRYQARSGLTRLVSSLERTGAVERSIRARWQPTYDIGLQLDLAANNSLLRSSEATSRRAYDLSTLSSTSDLRYSPIETVELGWRLRLSSSKDVSTIPQRTSFVSSNAVRGVLSILTRGRLSAEVERTLVEGENLGDDAFNLPYQLTDGYAIGVTWVGRVGFQMGFGSNIRASINYVARAQDPTMRVFHIGTAEVKAFF